MLVVSNGYCAEVGQDGYWSRPTEEEVAQMYNLDPRILPEVENHSAQNEILYAGLGYVSIDSLSRDS
jgi:hypothetical protein